MLKAQEIVTHLKNLKQGMASAQRAVKKARSSLRDAEKWLEDTQEKDSNLRKEYIDLMGYAPPE